MKQKYTRAPLEPTEENSGPHSDTRLGYIDQALESAYAAKPYQDKILEMKANFSPMIAEPIVKQLGAYSADAEYDAEMRVYVEKAARIGERTQYETLGRRALRAINPKKQFKKDLDDIKAPRRLP